MAKGITPANFKGLTGQTINGIQVIVRNPVNGPRGQVRYDCKCHCGTLFTARSGSLKDKGTKSCGCLQRLAAAKNGKALAKAETARNNVLCGYRKRCKDKGLSWQLSDEEATKFFQQNCHYCNREPASLAKAKSGTYTYNGIDRLDSSQGYILSNCVACCSRCNSAKNDMSVAEFEAWLKQISSYWLGAQYVDAQSRSS